MTDSRSLTADNVTLAYGDRVVVDGLGLTLAAGRITAIVGANGCGKSTLLRSLARLLPPREGRVLLDGEDINGMHPKSVARVLGLLPQSPIAPEGIVVADLVCRGRHPHRRHPHQKMLASWSKADYKAVAEALEATSIEDLAERPVDELSGGQRQRVWIAMALAQDSLKILTSSSSTSRPPSLTSRIRSRFSISFTTST
jgi:iron complex transport system ATP-binding protein